MLTSKEVVDIFLETKQHFGQEAAVTMYATIHTGSLDVIKEIAGTLDQIAQIDKSSSQQSQLLSNLSQVLKNYCAQDDHAFVGLLMLYLDTCGVKIFRPVGNPKNE